MSELLMVAQCNKNQKPAKKEIDLPRLGEQRIKNNGEEHRMGPNGA
jgi:hypothetical protein